MGGTIKGDPLSRNYVDTELRTIADRLRSHITGLAKKYPDLWSRIDKFREARGKQLPNWKDWCFLPMEAARAITTAGVDFTTLDENGHFDLFVSTPTIATLAPWRVTQGIYRFHPEVFETLWNTPLDGNLPVEFFFRLPEWCLYIPTAGKMIHGMSQLGFFVHLEYNVVNGHKELHLLLEFDRGFLPIYLDISRGNKIVDMVEGFVTGTAERERRTKEQAAEIHPMISLVLYLCSVTREFHASNNASAQPQNPPATKTKQGLRVFPANNPTIWDTGYRIGAAIQSAKGHSKVVSKRPGGVGGSPSSEPHLRRSHWHTYWKGPKNDPSKREIVLHWLPPILINYKPGQEVVPTFYPVK